MFGELGVDVVLGVPVTGELGLPGAAVLTGTELAGEPGLPGAAVLTGTGLTGELGLPGAAAVPLALLPTSIALLRQPFVWLHSYLIIV